MTTDNIESTEVRCSLCGEPLTQFGSKQLRNGVACRHCAEQFSPFYSDELLKEKSVWQMRRHRRWRERNAEKLADFNITRTSNTHVKLCIDDGQERFVFSDRRNPLQDNPDILHLSRIKGYQTEVRDYPDDPSLCDVYFTMELRRGQVKHVEFRVNPFPGIDKESDAYLRAFQETAIYDRLLKHEEKDDDLYHEPELKSSGEAVIQKL